ncbi:hypothetical protein AAHA92_32779 [Salvia divinorum]|uniref:Uncharacterized protein n=1 Tax=Salvia divinorum TaxID=28513 RepID=A0ABD1FLT8_SALDI
MWAQGRQSSATISHRLTAPRRLAGGVAGFRQKHSHRQKFNEKEEHVVTRRCVGRTVHRDLHVSTFIWLYIRKFY